MPVNRYGCFIGAWFCGRTGVHPGSRPGQAFAGTCAGERGFIIVAVLWIMMALATLAAIYATYVVRTAYAVGASDDRVTAEALFNAAIELTAYRLSVGPKEERPTHGRINFRLGRATVVAEFHSESGRIDLNGAQKPLLANLFVMLGAKPDDAEQFADRIIGWRTAAPQNGAPDPEADAYRVAGRNYKPRGGPFQEVGELWLVLGLPPAWVERVMPYVTVYGGAQVNILDAAPLVLAALGLPPEQVNAVLAQRDVPGIDGKTIMQSLGGGQSGATVEPSRAFRLSVGIQFDNGVRSVAEIVILLADDGDEPYRVLLWRDDFDQIASVGG
jgi:general secretion pathway protein K